MKFIKFVPDSDREARERRNELQKQENRLLKREENLTARMKR